MKGKQVVQFAQRQLPKKHVKVPETAIWQPPLPGWVSLGGCMTLLCSQWKYMAGMIFAGQFRCSHFSANKSLMAVLKPLRASWSWHWRSFRWQKYPLCLHWFYSWTIMNCWIFWEAIDNGCNPFGFLASGFISFQNGRLGLSKKIAMFCIDL